MIHCHIDTRGFFFQGGWRAHSNSQNHNQNTKEGKVSTELSRAKWNKLNEVLNKF